MQGIVASIALCGLLVISGCAGLPARQPEGDCYVLGVEQSRTRRAAWPLALFAAGVAVGLAAAWCCRRRWAARSLKRRGSRLLPEELARLKAALSLLEDVAASGERLDKIIRLHRHRAPPDRKL